MPAVARDEPEARRRETANTFPETYDAYLSRAAQRQPDKVDSALQALRSTVKNVAEDEGRRLQVRASPRQWQSAGYLSG